MPSDRPSSGRTGVAAAFVLVLVAATLHVLLDDRPPTPRDPADVHETEALAATGIAMRRAGEDRAGPDDETIPSGVIRVVDGEGRPLGGGLLFLRSGAFTTRHVVDAEGRAEVPIDFAWADVLAVHAERLPVVVPGLRLERTMTLQLDLAPAIQGQVTVDGGVPDRPLAFEVDLVEVNGDLARLWEEWQLAGAQRREIGSCRAVTDEAGALVVPGDRGTAYRARLVSLSAGFTPEGAGADAADGTGAPAIVSGRPFRLDLARRR